MASITSLPQASGYVFNGSSVDRVIFRRGKSINLLKITNLQVEMLLKEEPKYWSTHFQPKKKSSKAKSESKDV